MERKFFPDEGRGAQKAGFVFNLLSAGSSQNDDGPHGVERPELPEDGEPVHFWHFKVEHCHFRLLAFVDFEASLATIGEKDDIALQARTSCSCIRA